MIPERWLRVDVSVTPGDESGLIVERLVELGARAVVEELDAFVTYFPAVAEPDEFVAELSRHLGSVGVASPVVRWSWQRHEAWSESWKQGLAPRSIGRRLVVAPTWIDVEPDPEREVIRIDPGVAFGTAEHATTRGCLAHLDGIVRGGEAVLDLGSGSGILAIAALRLGAGEALAVEMDPMACVAATENATLNGVLERVRIREMNLSQDSSFGLGVFDIVVANMVMGLLTPRLPAMVDALDAAGTLVVGGVQAEERDSFAAAARSAGLLVAAGVEEDGWWSARLQHAPRPPV